MGKSCMILHTKSPRNYGSRIHDEKGGKRIYIINSITPMMYVGMLAARQEPPPDAGPGRCRQSLGRKPLPRSLQHRAPLLADRAGGPPPEAGVHKAFLKGYDS